MADDYVLYANSLSKSFGSFKAVHNVSFGLKKGEILGFLGPNGAGKTTTIQMLLGVLTPTSGSVSYFGKNLDTNREEILEKVNFSSPYVQLPWRLSPKEVLQYTSYLYDIPNRTGRVNRIISLFHLAPFINKEIKDLSAGQQTRLNLAKAFLNYPEVLLLDEPTASLDPESAKYIRDFLVNQKKEFNVSIIFTSHRMEEVEEICQRIVFIHHGKIIAEDTPENLPKKIKHARVTLVMVDGLKRTIQFCEETKLPYQLQKRSIEITIEEHKIADLLSNLSKKEIQYDQISIKKPDLEDFFLEVVKNNHETS